MYCMYASQVLRVSIYPVAVPPVHSPRDTVHASLLGLLNLACVVPARPAPDRLRAAAAKHPRSQGGQGGRGALCATLKSPREEPVHPTARVR